MLVTFVVLSPSLKTKTKVKTKNKAVFMCGHFLMNGLLKKGVISSWVTWGINDENKYVKHRKLVLNHSVTLT